MRRVVVILSVVALLGLGLWWSTRGPDRGPTVAPSADPVAAPRPAPRAQLFLPPVAGTPCRVTGVVEGGPATKVSLHSVRAGIDVPATLSEGGRRFEGELPEQGALEVVARASDGRSGSVTGRCDGSGAVELVVRLPEAEPSATRITGRCLYLETGVAVAEARVLGRWADGRDVPAFGALTEEDGRFDVPAPAGVFEVRCGKDGDESAPARVTLEPGRAVSLELFLAARATVIGTVRDAQGALPGVTVRGRPARFGADGAERAALTDVEGRFFLAGLPPGPVVVEAQDAGRFAEGHGVAKVALPYEEIDLELVESPIVVEGYVTADGAGLPGVEVEVVQLRGPGGRRIGPIRRAATTREDGKYEVGGLAEGKVRVAAAAPGRVPARAEVQVVPGRTRVDLRLLEACETTIVVEPADPSRPVSVRVHRDDFPDVRASGRTGAPIVVQSAPGAAEIYARSVGTEVATATLAATLCAGPLRLAFGAAEGRGALEVAAVRADGSPVSGVRIWVNAPGGMATTAEDGRVRFEDLEPRDYRVGTRDAEPVEVEVRAGETAKVELEVTREEGDVSGTVVSGGAPVEGAAILASCADSGRPRGLLGARVRARSDATGAFSFVPDDGGSCLVRAEHRSRGRSQPVLLRAGGEPGRIELEASASVAGEVVRASDGGPVEQYTLTVRAVGGAAGVEGRNLHVTAADGRFEVPDLTPGRIALSVRSAAGQARTELELAPGERRDGVRLQVFAQGEVTGRVVDDGQQPIPGARVRVEAYRRTLGRGVTGPDGRFTFSVPAGDPLRIYASAKGYYPSGSPTFDLGASGPTDVGTIVLEPRGGPEEKEGGIGIMFGGEADGIRVIRLSDDSPAREAGVQPGDLITAIDGVPFGAEPLVNWVVSLRGRAGTPVVLELRRGTDPPFSVTVIRRAIGLPAVPDEAP